MKRTYIKGISLLKYPSNDIAMKDLPEHLQKIYPRGLPQHTYRVEYQGKRETAPTLKKARVTLQNMKDKTPQPTMQSLKKKLETQHKIIKEQTEQLHQLTTQLNSLLLAKDEATRTRDLALELVKTAPILNEQQAYKGVVKILHDEKKLYSEEVKDMLVTLRYHLGVKESHKQYMESIYEQE